MLEKIRAFLLKNGNSSLAEIAIALDADKRLVQSALDELIRLGRILKNKNDSLCMGGCNGCSGVCPASVVSLLPEDEFYYSWR